MRDEVVSSLGERSENLSETRPVGIQGLFIETIRCTVQHATEEATQRTITVLRIRYDVESSAKTGLFIVEV